MSYDDCCCRIHFFPLSFTSFTVYHIGLDKNCKRNVKTLKCLRKTKSNRNECFVGKHEGNCDWGYGINMRRTQSYDE